MSETTLAESAPVTVVLVHGAFADSSSWNSVIERLQAANVQVMAAPNPLRGLALDSTYVASVFDQIPGPVLAVGHSYAGAVITNAAANEKNVVGLVYVAAFAPDENERVGEISAQSKDAILGEALVAHHYPTGADDATVTEFSINPSMLHQAFASDLSTQQAAVLAATQRPVSELAFTEQSGAPAWKNLPSWAVVAKQDRAAGADVVRANAARAGATTIEVDGSHLIMMSRPQVVTDVILSAVAAVGQGVLEPARM